MKRYADSSAVLAWLLDEPDGPRVGRALRTASRVMASVLTVLECDRVLLRLAARDPRRRANADGLAARLAEASTHWDLLPINAEVVERARHSFPDDMVRSLDAIHLASIAVIGGTVEDFEVLSLDSRVRVNARALGFRVLPA